jgi:hypothetical protein
MDGAMSDWSQRPDAHEARPTLATPSDGGLTDADHALVRRIPRARRRVVRTPVTAPRLATLAASP